MYLAADCLAAVFVCALLPRLFAAARRKGARGLWRALAHGDEALFLWGVPGGKAEAPLAAALPFLLPLAASLHAAGILLQGSLWPARWPFLSILADRVLDPAAILLLLAASLLASYTLRELAFCAASAFVLRWVFLNAQDLWLFYLMAFALAAKDADLGRTVRWLLATLTALVSAVALSSLAGLVENVYWADVWRERWSFGFTHPNTLGGFLMGIAACWIFLRAERWRWADLVPLAALDLFNQYGPCVRSVQITLRLALAALVLARLVPQGFWKARFVRLALALTPLWLFLFSFALSIWFRFFFGPVIDRLNILLTGRILLQTEALAAFPVRIAGGLVTNGPNVDNSFIASLLRYGPVVSLALWGSVSLALFRLVRTGRTVTALLTAVLLVYAFFEIIWFHLPGNPTLLLLSWALTGKAAPACRVPEPCVQGRPTEV